MRYLGEHCEAESENCCTSSTHEIAGLVSFSTRTGPDVVVREARVFDSSFERAADAGDAPAGGAQRAAPMKVTRDERRMIVSERCMAGGWL